MRYERQQAARMSGSLGYPKRCAASVHGVHPLLPRRQSGNIWTQTKKHSSQSTPLLRSGPIERGPCDSGHYNGPMPSPPEQQQQRTRRAGRPPASSPLVLEEAAAQLYLEQGYGTTTVAQITARAGVARSSFFNYFQAKADVLWSGFDAALDMLAELPRPDQGNAVIDQLAHWSDRIPAENVAMVFTQAEPMRLSAEDVSTAIGARLIQIATILHRRHGLAQVIAHAYAAAILTALAAWSRAGAEPQQMGQYFRAEIGLLTSALAPQSPTDPGRSQECDELG